MTREEAIKILKSKMDGSVDTSYEWTEAVRMAIEALSKNDCIGCKHQGQWENEYEMGYPSPCTVCRRRAKDNYEAICKQEG